MLTGYIVLARLSKSTCIASSEARKESLLVLFFAMIPEDDGVTFIEEELCSQ